MQVKLTISVDFKWHRLVNRSFPNTYMVPNCNQRKNDKRLQKTIERVQ